MGTIIKKLKVTPFIMLFSVACLLLASGCARYARTVDTNYEPSATVRGGAGNLYIVIPESQQLNQSGTKWVLGKVKDDDNRNIDEVLSHRSPAEIVQSAFGIEFKRAGYTVIPTTNRPAAEQQVIDLTKTEIELEQISDLVDLKANCRVLVGVDVIKNGQLIKRLQYESRSSRIDIKDRDVLVNKLLEEALQSVMLKAMPELHSLLNQ